MDGDRRNDVVVATDLGVNVFRQRGGTLSRPFVVPYTVGGYAVDIADMNRDGREDIIVRGGTWVRIARNLRGGFRGSIVARGRNQDVEAGDVNGDRRPDLVAASYKGRLRIYRQRRNGTFSRARIQRTRRGASAVAVADLTRDGRLDVATANRSSLEVLAQTANGRLRSVSVTPGIDYPDGIETLDLSGDGKVDLIARASESVGVVLQQGRGTFGGFDIYHAGRPISWHPDAIAAGDFTGDGRPDIAAAGGLGTRALRLSAASAYGTPGATGAPAGAAQLPAPPPHPGPLQFEPVRRTRSTETPSRCRSATSRAIAEATCSSARRRLPDRRPALRLPAGE